MRRLCLAVVPILFSGAAWGQEPPSQASPAPRSSCLWCHEQLDAAALEPTRHVADDVHFQKGLSCHDCHGGNPAAGFDEDPFAAHDEKKAFAGKPKRTAIPGFCARCHADAAFMKRFNPQARVDQLSEYRTSGHGKRNAAGDPKVAVCVDCHGVHGIRPVKDARSSVHPTQVAETCARCHTDAQLMGAYGLATNQHVEYRSSVHAHALYEKGDTSAPTCNDCHGSHGAAPPGVQTVANVCGSCHTREATLFRETEAKRSLNLTPCIQCVVCHDNHAVRTPTDEMLGVGPQSTCTSCHGAEDPPYKAAAEMGEALERLKARLTEAKDLLDRAERAGMEVSADQFGLRKGGDQLIEARVLVHSFDRERFLSAAEQGLVAADQGIAAGRRAFKELTQRRLGLAVSLLVIAAVIVGLVLKLRAMEREAGL